jgi:hypothetical protein
LVSSLVTSSWLYRYGVNATPVPAMLGAPVRFNACESTVVKIVVSVIPSQTNRGRRQFTCFGTYGGTVCESKHFASHGRNLLRILHFRRIARWCRHDFTRVRTIPFIEAMRLLKSSESTGTTLVEIDRNSVAGTDRVESSCRSGHARRPADRLSGDRAHARRRAVPASGGHCRSSLSAVTGRSTRSSGSGTSSRLDSLSRRMRGRTDHPPSLRSPP